MEALTTALAGVPEWLQNFANEIFGYQAPQEGEASIGMVILLGVGIVFLGLICLRLLDIRADRKSDKPIKEKERRNCSRCRKRGRDSRQTGICCGCVRGDSGRTRNGCFGNKNFIHKENVRNER